MYVYMYISVIVCAYVISRRVQDERIYLYKLNRRYYSISLSGDDLNRFI